MMMNSKLKILGWVGLTLLLSGCVSNTIPTAENILINLSSSFPNIWKLVTATSYVMGFSFAFKAIQQLKIYGEARTMMSSHTNLKTPVVFLIVAAALIFSPTMYQSMLLTTFGTTATTPLDYAIRANGISPQALRAFYQFIQMCGLFAFIRGWMIMSRIGEQSHQPQTFGKGLTHILGGLLAINIAGTKDVIFSTVGLN